MSNICYYLALFLIILIFLSLFNILKTPSKKDLLIGMDRKIQSVGNYFKPSYYPYKTNFKTI